MTDSFGRASRALRASNRKLRRLLAPVGIVAVLALAAAAPANAMTSATATAAPIGNDAILLTVTNTGSEAINQFYFSAGEQPAPTNFAPSTCTYGNQPVVASVTCVIAVAPGASAEVCYTGKAPFELLPGAALLLAPQGGATLTTAPAVSSCPVAGFKPGSGSSTGGATAKCKVPNLKGKSLAVAEKALTRANCAVGKIKKAKSSKKKGSVISQGTSAGKQLATGSKVSLVVSK